VCPQIFGLSLVKLAVALCLIGGVARQTPDGTSTRGEVHCLLAGDPGTGKSQFLRYALVPTPTAFIERVDLVGSHGRWERPCLQTAHMTL
jgi:DNA helicase MCM9